MEYEKEMRVFIDSVIANDMCSAMEEDELKDKIEQYIDEGYQFVVTETALDIPLFQNDWMWFENRLTISAGKAITIELWNSVEDMLSKPFYWMSAKCETETKPKEVAAESDLW